METHVELPDGVRLAVCENVSTHERRISFIALRQDFDFEGIRSQQVDHGSLYPLGRRMSVIVPNVADFLIEFPFLTRKQLALLCTAHEISVGTRDKLAWLRDTLRVHGLECRCSPLILEFQVRKHARRDVYGRQVFLTPGPSCNEERQGARYDALRARRRSYANEPEQGRRTRLDRDVRWHRGHRQVSDASSASSDDLDGSEDIVQEGVFPDKPNWENKVAIISDWQKGVSCEENRIVVCAVCAFACRPGEIEVVAGSRIDFTLLQNECVPPHAMPRSYNLLVYNNAILLLGLLDTERKGDIRLCIPCRRSLLGRQPRQPKFALANFLYYGHWSRCLTTVGCWRRFCTASPFERMLINVDCSVPFVSHYAGPQVGASICQRAIENGFRSHPFESKR